MLPILVNKDGCVFTDVWEGGKCLIFRVLHGGGGGGGGGMTHG